MTSHIEVYEHALVPARVRTALLALLTAFVLVIGLGTVPAAAVTGGTVTGVVTDSNGDPVPGVYAVALWLHNTSSPHFDEVDEDVTDGSGAFSLTVPAGTIRIAYYDPDEVYSLEYYDDAGSLETATDIPITDGGTATADASLSKASSVSGQVTRRSGDPRSRGVALLDPVTGKVKRTATVATDGSYRFSGVLPGSYKVAFNRVSGPALSAAQFWDSSGEHLGLGAADLLTVGEAATVENVDATLAEGGHITGVLRDPAGVGMQCTIQAYTADGSLVTRAVTSGVDGAFDLGGLTTGGYLLRVLGRRDCSAGRQWVTSASGALSSLNTDADPFAVTLGATSALATPLVYQIGTVANLTTPGVLGTTAAGSTLSATTGTWSQTGLTYSYRWFVGSSHTSWHSYNTFSLYDSYQGQLVRVQVRATKPGFRSTIAESLPVGPVLGPALTSTARPTIVGTPQVGAVLTATPGAWSEPGATYRYRWRYRQRVIQDGPKATLTVPDSAFNLDLEVDVFATKAGHATGVATSAVTAKVARGRLVILKAGKVKGQLKVGEKLTLVRAKLNAQAVPRITWRRNGVAIPGAKNKKSYTLTSHDSGARITVKVEYLRYAWTRAKEVLAPTASVGGRVSPE